MKKSSKRVKTLIILAAVLVLGVAGYFVADKLIPIADELTTYAVEDLDFFDTEEADLLKVSWTAAGNDYSFIREGDAWIDEKEPAFPVNRSKMSKLLSNFIHLRATMRSGALDDSETGFDDPYAVLRLTDSKGETVLTFGKKNSLGTSFYAKNGDGDTYLVGSQYPVHLGKSKLELLQWEEVPAYSDLLEVRFENEDGVVDVVRTPGDGGDTYTWKETGEKLDPERCAAYFDGVRYFYWADVVTYKATEDDIRSYGFDDASRMTLTYLQDGEEKSFTVLFGNFNRSKGYSYAKYPDSPFVYYVTKDFTAALPAAKEDLSGK